MKTSRSASPFKSETDSHKEIIKISDEILNSEDCLIHSLIKEKYIRYDKFLKGFFLSVDSDIFEYLFEKKMIEYINGPTFTKHDSFNIFQLILLEKNYLQNKLKEDNDHNEIIKENTEFGEVQEDKDDKDDKEDKDDKKTNADCNIKKTEINEVNNILKSTINDLITLVDQGKYADLKRLSKKLRNSMILVDNKDKKQFEATLEKELEKHLKNEKKRLESYFQVREAKILKESRIEESNSILKNFFENKVEDTKLKNKILSKDLNENLIIENAKKNIKEKLKYLGEDEELILKNRNSIGFISNSKKQNTTIYEKGKKHNEQKIEDEFYKSMRNRIFKKV